MLDNNIGDILSKYVSSSGVNAEERLRVLRNLYDTNRYIDLYFKNFHEFRRCIDYLLHINSLNLSKSSNKVMKDNTITLISNYISLLKSVLDGIEIIYNKNDNLLKVTPEVEILKLKDGEMLKYNRESDITTKIRFYNKSIFNNGVQYKSISLIGSEEYINISYDLNLGLAIGKNFVYITFPVVPGLNFFHISSSENLKSEFKFEESEELIKVNFKLIPQER